MAIAIASLFAGQAFAQDTVKIGVITDMTGTARFYAEPVTEGSKLAAKIINENGGVLGKPIELLIEDDQNKPDVASAKARKLVDEGAVFILCNSSSTTTQQIQSVSLETKTPQLTATNGVDTMTTSIDNPYFWQTGVLATIQLDTLMAYSKSRNYKRVAIWRDEMVLSQQIAESFRKGLESRGVEVVDEEVIARGATSAVPQLQKIRAQNPEAIFNAGILGPEMVVFFRGYHELGLKMPVLGSYNLSIPTYLRTAKDLMEGVVFVDAYDPDKKQVKDFSTLFEKEYSRAPYSMNAYGYDGINLIADAIRRAGSFDREKIRAAMQATRGWIGVIGAKDTAISFGDGKRTGFDPQGATIRVISHNEQGPVLYSGSN
jgi:branched-chain amino acid transport system substrate-binding protein